MIPTNTSGEWSAFLAHLPTGVAAANCGPCDGVAMGSPASGGAICAGTFNGNNYMITPSGCTDSPTPTCAGGTDTVKKTWRGTSGTNVDIAGIVNITDPAVASTQTGDTTTGFIIADASISSDSAAHYCHNMSFGGYSDWYLPSKSELAYVYCKANVGTDPSIPQENPNCIAGGKTSELTGFAGAFYWTSTESTASEAWYEFMGALVGQDNGNNMGYTKASQEYVRCIRKY